MNIEFEIPHGIAQDLSRIADSLDAIVAIMRGQHTQPIPVAIKALPDSESKIPENAPQAALPIADESRTAPAKEAKTRKTGESQPVEPEQPPATAEEVRAALVAASNAIPNGRAGVLSILAQFGARKVSDISADKYAAVVAACAAAVAESGVVA